MSESVLPLPENQQYVRGDPVLQLCGGAMLRTAREAQGLHIAALAVALKVPVKKLEALETGRYDLLPDTVFARALASSVCRTLKIDPTPILAQLPNTTGQYFKQKHEGINVPFRAPRDGATLSFWDQLSKPLVLAVLMLLVGAAALLFFPFAKFADTDRMSGSGDVTEIFPLSAPAPLVKETPTPPESTASGQSYGTAASGSDALRAINPESAPVSVSAAVPAFNAAATAPDSVGTKSVVGFKARGSSWVEVVDATGVVQLRKTMTNGETVGASGAMPLSVVVGRVDAMDVEVRGKPVDLTSKSKDNVARFEVK